MLADNRVGLVWQNWTENVVSYSVYFILFDKSNFNTDCMGTLFSFI